MGLFVVAIGLLQLQTVSWTSECTTVGAAVEEIAKQTARKLTVAPECREQTLVVRVIGADTDQVLAKIAEVSSAKWTKGENGELRLSRPRGMEIEQRSKSKERRLQIIREALNEMADEASKAYDADAAVAKMARLGKGSPAEQSVRSEFGYGADQPSSRAIHRLLKFVSAEKIADLEDEMRVVYSTHPTKMQTALGEKSLREVTWINNTHQELLKAIAKKPSVAHRFSWTDSHEWDAPVARLVLSIRAPGGHGPNMQLRAYSTGGKLIFQSLGTLKIKYASTANKPISLPTKVKLSDYEKGLQKALTDRFAVPRVGPTSPMPRAVLEGILDVEGRDATVAVPSRVFLNAAEQNNLQLVASLPADLFWLTQTVDESKPIAEFWQAAANAADVRLGGEWLTVRPYEFYSAHRRTFPRKAISRYFNELSRNGRESVMAYSELLASAETPSHVSPARQIGRLLAVNGSTKPVFDSSVLPFQFVGRLGIAAVSTLENEGLRLAALPQTPRDILARFVFGANGSVLMQLDNRAFRSEDSTEVLPNGLMGGSIITLSRRETACAFDATSGATFASEMPLDARNVAFQLVRKELGTRRKDEHLIDAFRMGSRTSWTFVLQHGGALSTTILIEETKLDSSQEPMSLNELPDKFRAEVERHMDLERKASTGSRVPPPLD